MRHWIGRAIAGVALALAAGTAVAQDEARYKYGTFLAENYYQAQADKYFAEEVTKRTNGKVRFQFFWQGSIGKDTELFALTKSGAVDFGAIVTGMFPSDLPYASVTNALPMVFSDGPKVVQVTRELYAKNPRLLAELKAANLQPLIFRHLPTYRIFCREPVKNMASLKGKKILTYGAYVPQMFNALGAVPVNINLTEVYEGLQRGTLDCAYLHAAAAEFRKWHEVAPYISDLDFGVINAYVIFMNRAKWEAMSPATQKIFAEVADEATRRAIADMQAENDKGLQRMLDKGAKMVVFEEKDAVAKAVPDMLQLWTAKMEGTGGGDAKSVSDEIRSKLAVRK